MSTWTQAIEFMVYLAGDGDIATERWLSYNCMRIGGTVNESPNG